MEVGSKSRCYGVLQVVWRPSHGCLIGNSGSPRKIVKITGLDTGNVVAGCVVHVLTAYAGTAWVYIGFSEKYPDWLSVVIPLDGDVRTEYTVGYRAVVIGTRFVTHELTTGHVNTEGIDVQLCT